MLYIIPFILLLFFSILLEAKKTLTNKHKLFIFIIVLSFFSLLMGFRYRVGGDTLGYMESFKYIPNLSDISFMDVFSYKYSDPLYTLLCSFSKLLSEEFYIFQLIHVMILNTLIGVFIVKNTSNILFALSFYLLICFFYFNTEILRESIAIAIFVNSTQYLINKKYLKFYRNVLIAIGFHLSAIILLFIPIFYRKKSQKKYIYMQVYW